MAINILFDEVDGIKLGGKMFPDSRKAQIAVLELLSDFFFHDGSIVATQSKVDVNTFLFTDARLKKSIEQSILVQNRVLSIHTNDSHLAWKLDESYSVEVWRKQNACGIYYYHYGEEVSRTLFMRGAK